MHPIERLRYVVRSGGVDDGELARETAAALAGMAGDPAGLVLSCKRLLDRHPVSGPLWVLAARVLTGSDVRADGRRVVAELDADPTAGHLAADLPDGARVVVLGWPDVVPIALGRRGDLCVLVVDALGEAAGLARALRGADVEADDIPEAGAGAAVAASDLVLLEARVAGPGGLLATAGSLAAAATARHAGVPVWAVVPAGRALPGPLWAAVLARLPGGRPWDAAVDHVPLDLVDVVVGPTGTGPVAGAAGRADCPPAPELC